MTLRDWLTEQKGRMTIRQFAERVRVSESTVHRWLTGENAPRKQQLVRIVKHTSGQVRAADFYEAA